MSPAPKSKSKEKSTSTSNKPIKEQNPQKPTQKPALSNGGGSGALASAYNPVSGTFHALDPADPATLLLNPVKFRSIDEPDDHSPTSHGDFDSASNHDSCSGESEDTAPKSNGNGLGGATTGHSRADSVPGCDAEKREKIRQKNEKKHQRQRERRAQELHERCSGYLMSRKLESLSQQLVAMGFSQEQATMALIQNEGRVEESVAWLFEGGEESRQPEGTAPDLHCGFGLKIDITDELAKIVALEKQFKCTKQEVERAVVACEGDLVKAEENLKVQKQEAAAAAAAAATRPKTPPPLPLKPEETVLHLSANQRLPLQSKVVGSVQPSLQQQKKVERDFNYARSQEPVKNLVQQLDRSAVSQANLDYRLKQQQHATTEKRWPVGPGNSNPYPASSSHMPASVPQLKPEPQFPASSNGMKGPIGVQLHPLRPLREPVVVMQRPQTINPGKQNIPSTSLGLEHSNGSIPGFVENKMYNRSLGQNIPGLSHVSNTGSTNGVSMHQFVNQSHLDMPVTNSWSNGSSLTSPSSLGLFTSWGASRPLNGTQQNEWGNGSAGGGSGCDYTSIDWSLDIAMLNSSSNTSIGSDRLSNTWSTMFMGGNGNMVRRSSTMNINNGGAVPYLSGFHEGNGNEARFNEWTSPFSGEDILGSSRKFVMSPPCRTGDSFLE